MKLNFKIKLISCGYFHVLILTENNELFGCGSNEGGQLGLGHYINRHEFTKIDTKFLVKKKLNPFSTLKSFFSKKENKTEFPDKITRVVCGGLFSTLLTKNNKLYLTGLGMGYQIGMKHYDLNEFTYYKFGFGKIKMLKCNAGSAVILNENGQFFTHFYKNNVNSFKMFYRNPDIIDFNCGINHIVMFDKFGQLFFYRAEKIIQWSTSFKIKQVSCNVDSFALLNEMNGVYVNFDLCYSR